jgi:hypothetical protein
MSLLWHVGEETSVSLAYINIRQLSVSYLIPVQSAWQMSDETKS